MQRAAVTKVLSITMTLVVLVSAFTFLSILTKPTGADEGGGCSSVVYSVKWVKQIDPARHRQLFVSTVPKGDDESRTLVVDGLPSKVFLVRLSDGSILGNSTDIDVKYGEIPNDQYAGGVVSSQEGGYVAWVTANPADKTDNWLHVVCTGNNGHSFTPTFYRFSLKGLTDPTTHVVVNLKPTNVDITQNGRYIVVGGLNGYIAVFQRTSGDDD